MRISAFLQLYNELSNGHLRRCLNNCREWADAIYIYDDASDDGSREVYLDYTAPERIILGETRDFASEIFHKQQLLDLVVAEGVTDWIVWIDGDAVFDRELTLGMRDILATVEAAGGDSASVAHLNLWRHPAWYRLDSQFNDLRPVCFWKNTGRLRYCPVGGLHRQQFPDGLEQTAALPQRMLHYGFSTREGIVRKYLTYKAHGAPRISRLVNERRLAVAKVPIDAYPDGLLPEDYDTCEAPTTMSYRDVRRFPNQERYELRQQKLRRMRMRRSRRRQ